MQASKIEMIVDSAFDKALREIQPRINMELRPNAFANEYSWLRVKAVFDLNNSAIRKAVKDAMTDILGDPS